MKTKGESEELLLLVRWEPAWDRPSREHNPPPKVRFVVKSVRWWWWCVGQGGTRGQWLSDSAVCRELELLHCTVCLISSLPSVSLLILHSVPRDNKNNVFGPHPPTILPSTVVYKWRLWSVTFSAPKGSSPASVTTSVELLCLFPPRLVYCILCTFLTCDVTIQWHSVEIFWAAKARFDCGVPAPTSAG